MIRVLLVAESRLFREGIRGILLAEDDLDVPVEASCPDEAVSLAREYCPDIVLLDGQIHGMSTVMTIRQFSRVSPGTRTVVLSGSTDTDLIASVATAGAAAFLSKDIGGRELCAELRSVAADSRTFALRVPLTTRLLIESDAPPLAPLTDREIEILSLVSLALSNVEIASRLHLSEGTVKRHLTNTFAKLKARSRLDAVNRAIALGMIKTPESRPLLS